MVLGKTKDVRFGNGICSDFKLFENESQIMGIKKTFPSRLWLAEGVGMVKQESYKKT